MFKIWIKIDIFYIGKRKCIAIKTCYFWLDTYFLLDLTVKFQKIIQDLNIF